MDSITEPGTLESGGINGLSKEVKHGRTVQVMSSSSLRTRSDMTLVSRVRYRMLRMCLANLQEVLLGTRFFFLFPAIPLAVVADRYRFGQAWVFALSLLGLAPLAERVCFLTEQIAFYTSETVGGLLNATCGNATELIIALFALREKKIDVVKYSLMGSILSNLLLVLGTALFFGGLANLGKEQKYDRKQADVNTLLLLLALLCDMLPMLFKYAGESSVLTDDPSLKLSRASSIVMLIAYTAYIIFQFWTHRQYFEAQQEEGETDQDDDQLTTDEVPVIGWRSGVAWLVGMTCAIALLSEYIVRTIEDTAESWGLSVSFISIIVISIVGNAAEHAGAVTFAVKNKLDISLGVALGSATQVALFVVPVNVVVGWIIGIDMDLSFSLLETGSLALAIITVGFALQDGTSHYMKGLVLLLFYVVIAACFFVLRTPLEQTNGTNVRAESLTTAALFRSL